MNRTQIIEALRKEAEKCTTAANILSAGSSRPGRGLSQDARARIAAAQRKRWAKVRRAKAA